MVLVDSAVLVAAALVGQVSTDWALEEALATYRDQKSPLRLKGLAKHPDQTPRFKSCHGQKTIYEKLKSTVWKILAHLKVQIVKLITITWLHEQNEKYSIRYFITIQCLGIIDYSEKICNTIFYHENHTSENNAIEQLNDKIGKLNFRLSIKVIGCVE